eukprot:7246611-Pyramimonas_sp.AAC.1
MPGHLFRLRGRRCAARERLSADSSACAPNPVASASVSKCCFISFRVASALVARSAAAPRALGRQGSAAEGLLGARR